MPQGSVKNSVLLKQALFLIHFDEYTGTLFLDVEYHRNHHYDGQHRYHCQKPL